MLIISVVAGSTFYMHFLRVKDENARMSSNFSGAVNTLNRIEESLNELRNRELILHDLALNREIPGYMVAEQKERILRSITEINSFILFNLDRLNLLEKQLEENNVRIGGMQQMIENLRRTISEREATIVSLRKEIDNLSTTLAAERRISAQVIAQKEEQIQEQTEKITQQQEAIAQKILEENTIYYVIGTRRDLINKEFLSKSGIFSRTQISRNYAEDTMMKLNLLEVSEIEIEVEPKRVKILSLQDADSYELKPDGSFTKLVITNKEKFRNVKYLLIQI